MMTNTVDIMMKRTSMTITMKKMKKKNLTTMLKRS